MHSNRENGFDVIAIVGIFVKVVFLCVIRHHRFCDVPIMVVGHVERERHLSNGVMKQ